MQISVTGIGGIPEVRPGDDLAGLILAGCRTTGLELQAGDVLVVTQKVVSKAEGRLVNLDEVEPSAFAQDFARAWEIGGDWSDQTFSLTDRQAFAAIERSRRSRAWSYDRDFAIIRIGPFHGVIAPATPAGMRRTIVPSNRSSQTMSLILAAAMRRSLIGVATCELRARAIGVPISRTVERARSSA